MKKRKIISFIFFSCLLSCSDSGIPYMNQEQLQLNTHKVIFTSEDESTQITADSPWYVSSIYSITQDTLYQVEWTKTLKQRTEAAGILIEKDSHMNATVYNKGMAPNDCIIINCQSSYSIEMEQVLITYQVLNK